jgi:arsenate reductase
MEFDSVKFSADRAQTDWEEEANRLRKMRPRHLLFLCVENSARSQMAEGIARHLAPVSVRVYSAGSRPSRVKPLAVRALGEVGIDISRQSSKGLDAIPLDQIDAVVTLCQEEVCPLFPRPVMSLHWPLADPAEARGGEESRLERFRQVRDELMHRLKVVFGSPPSTDA